MDAKEQRKKVTAARLRPQQEKCARQQNRKESRRPRARLHYDGNYIDRRRTDVLAGVYVCDFYFHRLSLSAKESAHTQHIRTQRRGEGGKIKALAGFMEPLSLSCSNASNLCKAFSCCSSSRHTFSVGAI
jgi:hypothetical protein